MEHLLGVRPLADHKYKEKCSIPVYQGVPGQPRQTCYSGKCNQFYICNAKET